MSEENLEKSWVVFGNSVIGKSHIKRNLPCQDNHYYQIINSHWGVAIVSDGAGSAKYSEQGSSYIANEFGEKTLPSLLEQNVWFNKGNLPSETEWQEFAETTINFLRNMLKVKSDAKKDIKISDLSATVIILVFSHKGVLSINVGDGRAAYRNANSEWKAIIDPFRGEEANQTVFVTSLFDEKNYKTLQKDFKKYIRTKIIKESITAFAVLSDGVEKASFLCSKFDEANKKWEDPNIPYKPFFEPIHNMVVLNKNDDFFNEGNKERIKRFLKSGNEKLKNEEDDKTLIMGVFC